ncbi:MULTISPECIES: MerR family transcriptional regulator [unclassified Enterococcus]|jgi:MerR family transcriptional activator of bmr gene|uniref:MerR family transcriptional regulator n=1 Tax=unclassified Enterococcus TaxID=2608891 RepID=UPI003D2A2291
MAEKELLTIGEISKMKDISIKALRYYHEEGILIPAYVDPANGYRFYTADQLFFLDLIKICRENHVRIKEIKELFDQKSDQSIKTFLTKKEADIHEEIRELQNRLTVISALNRTMEEDNSNYEEVTSRFFDERYLLQLPASGDEIEEIKLFDHLDKLVQQFGMKTTFRYGLVHTFDQLGVEKKIAVFCEVTQEDYLNNPECGYLKILPKGMYLVKNCEEKETSSERKKLLSDHSKTAAKEPIYSFYLVKDIFQVKNPPIQLQISQKPTGI